MKFRIRPGFRLFKSHDEAIEFECRGAASGIKPRAVGGDVINLTAAEVSQLGAAGQLGKYEPVDAAALEAFGITVPIESKLVTNPELYARPAPEPVRDNLDWRYG